ncbi:hypothetical protein IE81DRAFT_330931 [Ceraceosorus guamensis]|uniref:Uncharacterized protein n=1 Tax=Ceraceosorus guamensis TaxID=1522189 RepID=A0A316VVV5_9BASI|nr:hypothetical protein IE81DRAFT_330931 [Ceraceosorus guamensis]PWN41424.1 hypothetical protein IE81DRAFT_330931 [Ceraceosorus guamensis]
MTAYDENDRKEASVHASIKPRSRPLVPPLRFSVVAFSPYPSNSAAPAPHSNHSQHAAAAACKDDVQATSPKIQDAPKDATSCLAQTLYRGSHPKARNLPFLSRLRLRSILSLTPKPLSKSGPFKASDDRIEEWAQRRGCRLEWIECEKGKEEEVALDRESADRAIAFILDKRNLPCYVHDLDALQVSSLLVALLRKVQAWSHASIQLEMRFNLCFGTGNVFKPNLSNTASQAGQSAKGTELEDDDSSVAMAFVKKWHQSAGPLQTRDPQSKSEARHALFADDLARPSAADGASAASTSKLQNGQLQLAPRRHIPDWVWPAPHPLSRLADPYDVLPFAAFAEVSKRDSQAVGREKDAKSSDGSSTASKNAPSVGNLSGRQSKRSSTLIEGAPDQAQYPFASNLTASTSVSARSSPRLVKAALPSAHGAAAHTPDTESVSSSSSGTAHIGVGSLPVLHPTLRLSFEVDPTLPAPPSSSKHAQKAEQPVHPQPGALSSRPATPARTSSPRPSGSSAVVRSRERTMLPPLSDQNRTLAFSAPTTPGPSRPQTPVRHANGSGSGNARSADASFQGKASSSPSISAAADLLRSANTSIGPSRATSPGRSASKLGDDARAAVEGDLADSKMETRSPAGGERNVGSCRVGLVWLGCKSPSCKFVRILVGVDDIDRLECHHSSPSSTDKHSLADW